MADVQNSEVGMTQQNLNFVFYLQLERKCNISLLLHFGGIVSVSAVICFSRLLANVDVPKSTLYVFSYSF
jgi:hypothetical protein